MTRSLARRLLLAIAAFSACVWSGCVGIVPWRTPPLTLVWYGVTRQVGTLYPTYGELRDGTELATDDGVQLFLTVKPSAYVYVLHQTAAGQFAVWWPTETGGFNALAEEGRVQTLPSRGRAFTMEIARGIEAIYIIASRKPVNTVDQLTRELQWLFVTAQAIAAEVPQGTIRTTIPPNLQWKLDLKNPDPVVLVDQHLPVATTVRAIGNLRRAEQQWVTTAEGGTYVVQAERLQGRDVVARVIRIRRKISRSE